MHDAEIYKTYSTTGPTSVIHLILKYESYAFQRRILGGVNVGIFELLKLGEGKKGKVNSHFTAEILYNATSDVVLKLEGIGKDKELRDRGEIVVQFWSEDNVKASTTALEDVRQVVKEQFEEKKSATKSLGRVLSKLQVFAAILDETSKVSSIGYNSLRTTWFSTTPHTGSPLRQHCMESRIFNV